VIFGTLFEQSLDKPERHAYGAYFTSEADIQKVVLPSIVGPWRKRIEGANTLKDLGAPAARQRLLEALGWEEVQAAEDPEALQPVVGRAARKAAWPVHPLARGPRVLGPIRRAR
jgi:hypothetical protein